MAAPKFIIQHTIATKASIKAVGHAELQKKYGRKGHVVFGRHTPDWKLMRVHVEWNDAKKLEAGLKSVTMGEVGKGITAFKRGVDDSKKELEDGIEAEVKDVTPEAETEKDKA